MKSLPLSLVMNSKPNLAIKSYITTCPSHLQQKIGVGSFPIKNLQ